MSYGVALFHTTAMAMKAEKALVRAGFKITLVPTPRQFSSDCGIAARFDIASKANVMEVMEKSGVEVAGLHEM